SARVRPYWPSTGTARPPHRPPWKRVEHSRSRHGPRTPRFRTGMGPTSGTVRPGAHRRAAEGRTGGSPLVGHRRTFRPGAVDPGSTGTTALGHPLGGGSGAHHVARGGDRVRARDGAPRGEGLGPDPRRRGG